jgi:hypothetical protein
VVSSSLKMRSRSTSIIVPTGAVSRNRFNTWGLFQKLAIDCWGGELVTWAGVATDTEVSDTSLLFELTPPNHSMLQVTLEPCAAGGDHMATLFTRTLSKSVEVSEFATVHIVPAAPKRPITVMFVGVAEVEVNLYL